MLTKKRSRLNEHRPHFNRVYFAYNRIKCDFHKQIDTIDDSHQHRSVWYCHIVDLLQLKRLLHTGKIDRSYSFRILIAFWTHFLSINLGSFLIRMGFFAVEVCTLGCKKHSSKYAWNRASSSYSFALYWTSLGNGSMMYASASVIHTAN